MARRRWARFLAVILFLLIFVVGGAAVAGARIATAASFNAGAGAARFRCEEQRNDKMKNAGGAAASCEALAGGGDGDDKRAVPTGPNPLHNR
ncbi:hypothetical protein BRADI_3g03980v3 [Brachypodium distachyon]|uniref:Uncharacterized protein n=1 Tax=Brachypodium distachyon TaxID=15368 RepID=I1HX95_BRADI|nr:hypothetical protein BRADI_3g03980v3 [Brachypodium distachyon]